MCGVQTAFLASLRPVKFCEVDHDVEFLFYGFAEMCGPVGEKTINCCDYYLCILYLEFLYEETLQ